MTDLKILFFDIETSPALSYHYGLFDQNISIKSVKEDPRKIAFTAKWRGQKKIIAYSEYHQSRSEMLQAMWDLMDEADVVVGWNSRRFDVPWVNSEFMVEGMPPPSPFKQIDLMAEVKRNARFLSNKLDYISWRLLEDKKREYNMLQMWVKVDNPDTTEDARKKEWNATLRYARKDTALLEPLFDRILPWVKMPHPISESGDEARCHSCNSADLQRRGFHLTITGRYQRYRCNDCGSWFRGTARISSSPVRAI